MKRSLYPRLLPVLLLAGACAGERPSGGRPAAEFLVAAGDSTYWVRSDSAGVRMRGAPLVLARTGGRFYELYVTDDDRSYYDAVLVGQRVYRRDLVTGDSAVVLADSLVPALAGDWEAAHPDARPLLPDEEASEHPSVQASSEITLVGVHGPYVSVEVDSDLDVEGTHRARTVRHAVADLRTGLPVSLPELVGSGEAGRVVAAGRRLFADAIDSVLAARDDRARQALAALDDLRFDERSFSLDAVRGQPAVRFHVPGIGRHADGLVLPLPPVPVRAAPWWQGEVRDGLADTVTDDGAERWRRPAYALVARPDSEAGTVRLALRAGRREWPIGRVVGPAHHVFWLDRGVAPAARAALGRTFDEAARYDEDTRVVRLPSTDRRPFIIPVHDRARPSPSPSHRRREPARVGGADDAHRREHPGARLRGIGARDDGQGRGGRRLPARTLGLRHRVDRPGGLQGADPRG